jgi:hypothetical protein
MKIQKSREKTANAQQVGSSPNDKLPKKWLGRNKPQTVPDSAASSECRILLVFSMVRSKRFENRQFAREQKCQEQGEKCEKNSIANSASSHLGPPLLGGPWHERDAPAPAF